MIILDLLNKLCEENNFRLNSLILIAKYSIETDEHSLQSEFNAFNLEVRARSNKKKERMKEPEWSFHLVIDPTIAIKDRLSRESLVRAFDTREKNASDPSCQDFNCMGKAIELHLSFLPRTELKGLSSFNLF